MIDRLKERQEIGARLDARTEAWQRVNDIPEIQRAREAKDDARRAWDVANDAFNALFNKHAPREDELVAAIREEHPEVVAVENTSILRCAVTRLPLFAGDLVYVGGGEEDYEKAFILAAAVTLTVGDLAAPVHINSEGCFEDED